MKILTASIMVMLAFSFSSTAFAQESEEFSEEYVEYIMGYVENIRDLLEQTRAEYANGNTDKAYSLATKAYIDNYEFIEFELEQYDEELIEDVEWMMREELRGMIKDNAPVSEVDAKIDQIQTKMDGIAAIVPEFGILTMLVLVTGIVSVLVVTQKNKGMFLRI